MLSKACEYAIRALVYIANYGGGSYVTVNEMSENMNISFHFLTKILQSLKTNGLVASYRGPKGGVMLAKNPKQIFMLDVIEIIDGLAAFERCVLGLKDCGKETPCPVHSDWTRVVKETKKVFSLTSIDKLSKKLNKHSLRISDIKFKQ